MAMNPETSWRGVPISEIIGSVSPWGAPEFPLVTPTSHHSVLYHIPSEGLRDDQPPKPRVGEDKWDSEHVRLPCSSKSLYPVEDSSGETHLKKRWEMICAALSRPITSSEELADAIISYNTKFRSVWRFTALHSLFNDHLDEEESRQFFIVTLPAIAKLALDLPKLVQAPIPLLKQNKSKSISMTQLQIASLLANAFFCTFPRRNTMKRASEYASYPNINFSSLYEMQGHDDVIEKLKCLCHYFRRVTTQAPVGVVTVARRSALASECPRWGVSERHISSLPIHVDPDGRIEDAHGLIQVDFANKYLGGGVLGHGSVQEEIRFVICPEMIISMLFTEVLRPKEALLMIGCERYSEYGGYSRTFQWRGDHRDSTPRDSSLRRRVCVLALDALPYHHPNKQYGAGCLIRELNKAWIGMSFFADEDCMNYPGVATGNWGCGAFGGSPDLKSLIQIMACTAARRPMAYYTFHDLEIRDQIINIYNLLVRYNITVGQLYHYIMRFAAADVPRSQLHAFLHQAVVDDASKPTPTHKMDMKVPSETPTVSKDEEFDRIERELNRNSPDLFSQDELSQNDETETSKERDEKSKSSTKRTPDTKRKSTSKFTWDWDKPSNNNKDKSQQNIENPRDLNSHTHKQNENKTASSEKKITTNNQTSRLFDEMQKFDEDNGKLNLSYSVTKSLFKRTSITKEPNHSFDIRSDCDVSNENNEINSTPNEIKIADELMAIENEDLSVNDTVVASSSNLTCTQKSRDLFASDSNSTEPSSENKSQNYVNTTIDKMEMSPEDTRKKARKITDYFTKKCI